MNDNGRDMVLDQKKLRQMKRILMPFQTARDIYLEQVQANGDKEHPDHLIPLQLQAEHIKILAELYQGVIDHLGSEEHTLIVLQ